MKRSDCIKKISDKSVEWDIIVIGGGASGLGAGIDAASRGYKTLVLEGHDFAKGTSSRSTKLVHGGVRYLAQGYVDLVWEALKERGRLAENAAHLVKTQDFIIPNYTLWDSLQYMVGLTLYDMLSGRLSLGKTRIVGKQKTLEGLPNIKEEKLKNGVIYTDGQFDDSRLAVNMAQTIQELGGCAVNYTKVVGFLKDENGKINGVNVLDVLSGESYEVKTKLVINATGVFINELLNTLESNHEKFVVPSQGIHFVLDKSFLKSDNAIMIPKTSDGRVLFVVPWHDKCVVGTTDTLIDEESYEPKALPIEVDFVMETAHAYLTKKPTRDDVLSVFAGLRPLAAPKDGSKSTKEVSRSHKIIVHEGSEMITITGGKWTSYRKMAEDVVNKAISVHGLPKKECNTKNLSIHGNMPKNEVDRSNHLYVYGTDIPAIKALRDESPRYAEKIHPDYDYRVAEVVWAVREEMAMQLEDILARRVRLLFLDARAAIDSAEKVATIMAEELGYDKEWIDKQTKEFIEMAKGYLLVDYSPTK